jgi:hypothetical protein
VLQPCRSGAWPGQDQPAGSMAAGIGNAVCHATGKRVRDLPITLDKLV